VLEASQAALPFHEGAAVAPRPAATAVFARNRQVLVAPLVRAANGILDEGTEDLPAEAIAREIHPALPFVEEEGAPPPPTLVFPLPPQDLVRPPDVGDLALTPPAPLDFVSPQPPAALSPKAVEPAEIEIELFAAISAELIERRALRAETLASHGVSEPRWVEVVKRWSDALAEEERAGGTDLRDIQDAAFVAAWEAHRGALNASDYVRLSLAAEGSGLAAALEALGIRRTVWTRLKRVWSRRMASDRNLAAAVERERTRQRRR
jgi:hypothetical protein